MNNGRIPLAEQNEQVIKDYFEARPGWEAQRLSSGADFRICRGDECFLCEVKTIKSTRANLPYAPEDFFIDERNKQQKEVEDWLKENPDKRLFLSQEEWQFIYGDEAKFREKYRRRRRNTEAYFCQFSNILQECLEKLSINHLPYRLRIDSDDLYVPTQDERDAFLKWLENEILGISRGAPSRYWNIEQYWNGDAFFYSTFYQIHRPDHEGDMGSEYQLLVIGPLEVAQLQIEIHFYGVLNIDAIDRNIRKALRQLEYSALQEIDQQIPRVIMLAFESGIGFEWQQLTDYIMWLLAKTPTLSAVVVLDWVPDGTPPPAEDDFWAWLRFHRIKPKAAFVVYHNHYLQEVKPLPVDAFSDR